jgi:signal transduction histidine kinase
MVQVTSGVENGDVVISVRDDGEGIDPRVLPYIFDRFRQGDGSKTRRHGGLGLGLSIARDLAAMHGGSLNAATDGPGRGACFTLRLPATRPGIAVLAP